MREPGFPGREVLRWAHNGSSLLMSVYEWCGGRSVTADTDVCARMDRYVGYSGVDGREVEAGDARGGRDEVGGR